MAVDFKTRLASMTAAATKPVLSDAMLVDLLTAFAMRDRFGTPPGVPWSASTYFEIANIRRIPTVQNGHIYQVTTTGETGTVEPTWPLTSGGTVTDGSVVWTEAGLYRWIPTYRLRAAAAEGWRQKAGMLSGDFNVGVGTGVTFNRSEAYEHCIQQAEMYSKGLVGSMQMEASREEQRELEYGRREWGFNGPPDRLAWWQHQ